MDITRLAIEKDRITAVAILLGDRGALKKDGNPATEILPLKW